MASWHSVKQRTGEIGVRVALGASRTRVLNLVLGEGTATVAVGLVFGLTGALALTYVLSSFLYDVRKMDPLTLTAVPILFLFVTMAACFVPGWKAARVNPIRSLRCD